MAHRNKTVDANRVLKMRKQREARKSHARFPPLKEWTKDADGWEYSEPPTLGGRMYRIDDYSGDGKLWVCAVRHTDGSEVYGSKIRTRPRDCLADLRADGRFKK